MGTPMNEFASNHSRDAILNKEDYQITREFKNRLSSLIDVIDLRVFGSTARSDAVGDSDLDTFIELDKVTPPNTSSN